MIPIELRLRVVDLFLPCIGHLWAVQVPSMMMVLLLSPLWSTESSEWLSKFGFCYRGMNTPVLTPMFTRVWFVHLFSAYLHFYEVAHFQHFLRDLSSVVTAKFITRFNPSFQLLEKVTKSTTCTWLMHDSFAFQNSLFSQIFVVIAHSLTKSLLLLICIP